MTVTLSITGPYPDEGWWDEENDAMYYNDTVTSLYGDVGAFRAEEHNGQLVILRADRIVLFRRGFPDQWIESTVGFALNQSPFGFDVMKVSGTNGALMYKLIEEDLEWADALPGTNPLEDYQLGILIGGHWLPLGEIPTGKRTVTKTEHMKMGEL